jgi:hypothetical protein
LVGNALHGFNLACENHPAIPANYFRLFLKGAGPAVPGRRLAGCANPEWIRTAPDSAALFGSLAMTAKLLAED